MAESNSERWDPAAPRRDEPSDYAPTRMRYTVLAVGGSLAFLSYLQRQGFTRGQTYIADDLKFDHEQMGYLASAFLFSYGLFQVPCGLLGDRLGARHLLTILMLGSSLATGAIALVAALAHGPWQFPLLFCLRFLFGSFQAGTFPLWSRVMTDWMPLSQRGTAQGTVWMFSRLGGVIGPFVFLGLLFAFQTWTTPFWFLGGLGIAWCIAFWIWFRNRPEEMPQVNAAELQLIARGRETKKQPVGPIPWLALLRSVNVWALCMMYGFTGMAGNFITNLLPNYLERDRGFDARLVTVLAGLPLAAGIVSCALGGYLSDFISRHWHSRKWGRRFNGMIGLALAGLALLAVPWVQPVWMLGFLFSASFFCNDLNIGPAWAACADVGEKYAGTISGAMNMTGNFLGAAGMAFAGWMLRRGHAEGLFTFFACSYVMAALCWLAVDVTRPLLFEHNQAEFPVTDETR